VAESPTGPWPKMAMISPPCRLSRFNANGAFEAHLRPARAAMLTAAATGVVVIHHPLAAASLLGSHPCADCDHDPAGLVAGDHWLGATLESRAGIPRLKGGAVDVQVTAAHTRRS